jgi:hypothetical protein
MIVFFLKVLLAIGAGLVITALFVRPFRYALDLLSVSFSHHELRRRHRFNS